MWGYFRRRKAREVKRRLLQNARLFMKMNHQDKLMVNYEEIFQKRYGYKPNVSFSNGWYRIIGKGWHVSFREADFITATNVMEAEYEQTLSPLPE